MHLTITEPTTGVTLLSRLLDDTEVMDAEKYAREYARSVERELAPGKVFIPNCLGDIRVTFVPDPATPWHIWAGESFYFVDDTDF